MDWNEFSDSVINQRDNRYGGNRWMRAAAYANPNLIEEANAKEHFAFNKSTLLEVLEDVYFPVISPQEHDQMYSRHDMAIKQQHSKLVDTIVIELTALTQILHGLNDNNEQADTTIQNKQYKAGEETPGGDVFARPNISHNQTMIVGGLMKRLLSMLPVNFTNQK